MELIHLVLAVLFSINQIVYGQTIKHSALYVQINFANNVIKQTLLNVFIVYKNFIGIKILKYV